MLLKITAIFLTGTNEPPCPTFEIPLEAGSSYFFSSCSFYVSVILQLLPHFLTFSSIFHGPWLRWSLLMYGTQNLSIESVEQLEFM
jgi:hypothetical protein